MIDLHCHILPGIDDGARDLEDSLAMARQAEQDGIEVVCATPHLRADHNVVPAELAGRVAALQEQVDAAGIAVRIATGGEVAATIADELTDEELRWASLDGGGWLLLEPAPGPMDDALHELVDRLHARGFEVVLAHPERHAGPDFVERLRRLTEQGALIQWTAEFVELARAGDHMLLWAIAGFVHLLSSDSHSSHVGRPVALSGGYRHLRTVCSERRMRWIRRTAPDALIGGGHPPPMPH